MIQDYLAGKLFRMDAGHLIDELKHLLEIRHPNLTESPVPAWSISIIIFP